MSTLVIPHRESAVRFGDEWRENPLTPIHALPPHIIVTAECAACHHRAVVPEAKVDALRQSFLVQDLQRMLRCTNCTPRGKRRDVKIFIRKKPRG